MGCSYICKLTFCNLKTVVCQIKPNITRHNLHYLLSSFDLRCSDDIGPLCGVVKMADLTTPSFRAELKQSVEYSHDIYEFVVDKTNGTYLLFLTLFLCKILIYAKLID